MTVGDSVADGEWGKDSLHLPLSDLDFPIRGAILPSILRVPFTDAPRRMF